MISIIFYDILNMLLYLYKQEVQLPTAFTFISDHILQNPYFQEFYYCLGTLDNTYIKVYLSLENHAQYRNRKQTLSQNILTVYNFELLFVYTLPG
ncbi:hypothetical protein F5884DRAFT_687375 [Xylogone sp. PMI_703]|nr:hypothetical protein F5884DRAFT_687375 [Xylogone sp. PMI_703]